MRDKVKAKTWLKGKFRLVKGDWVNKVCGYRTKVVDAFNNNFETSWTIWYPKLTPKYTKPCVQLNVANGSASVLMTSTPEAIKKACQDIIDTLNSEKWIEAYWRIEDFSHRLIDNGEIVLEEEIVDINLWQKEILKCPDLTIIGMKEKALDELSDELDKA